MTNVYLVIVVSFLIMILIVFGIFIGISAYSDKKRQRQRELMKSTIEFLRWVEEWQK